VSAVAAGGAPVTGRRSRLASLTGTRPLLVVSLREDARNIAPWVGGITALSASSVLAYAWIFTDPAQREQLAATLGTNPALSLIFGPARNLLTADGFNAWRAGMLGALFAGLMAILIVVRNSRANEDSGQAELIASGVIARQSRLAVAVLMAVIASVAAGIVCFLVTIACGGGATPTLILSATFAASGLMFAGVAAVAAQLGADARTASTIAIGSLGVLFMLRGYIDASGSSDWGTWLTPFGWLEATRPATEANAWPLLLFLGFATVLVLGAFVLQGRRDFGQGLLAQRAGPATAGLAGNVWGLAVKLNRGSLVSWLIGFAALGLVFGNLATSIGNLVAHNPAFRQILASGAIDAAHLTFAFLVTILEIIAIIAAVMGVQIVLRVYAEETDYRVEPLLAGSLRRVTYLASNALIALVGVAFALLVAGTTLGLVASARDKTISTADVVWQSVVTIPAVWALVGLALAAVGAAPRLRMAAWLGIVATFGLTILGPTFKAPEWAMSFSPLHHVPNVIAPSPDWTGLAWVSAFAVVFLAVGFVGYTRRDII
jgi:ABC-2 type transport system permease protein